MCANADAQRGVRTADVQRLNRAALAVYQDEDAYLANRAYPTCEGGGLGLTWGSRIL